MSTLRSIKHHITTGLARYVVPRRLTPSPNIRLSCLIFLVVVRITSSNNDNNTLSNSMSGMSQPSQYRPVGIALAVSSGMLIGSSFVFKKKGLLSSQKGKVAGEGLAYLKSPMWWTGMTIMILGELCNFAAYAFLEAIIVTPLGALSVVISAILSHFILRERLSLFGWIGSIQCILGAAILAINAPPEQSVSDIAGFKRFFLAPGFLAYGSVVILTSVILAGYVAPRWGKKSMFPYIGICSLVGGLSVSCTQGLGACILTSIRGQNQFKNWFIYFLLLFVLVTLVTEIYYLNVALALFNTAMVTPTYYVMFTFCTLVTSIILYQGLKASAQVILTVVLAFLVICTGITILQMSRVDPRKLVNVDDQTALLLEAAKQEIDSKGSRDIERLGTLTTRASHSDSLNESRQRRRTMSTQSRALSSHPLSFSPHDLALAQSDAPTGVSPFDTIDDENSNNEEEVRTIIERTEEPGMDSLRGFFGAIGTLIRIRRRTTALSEANSRRGPSTADGRNEFSEQIGRPSSVCSEGISVNHISSPREPDGNIDINAEKADPKQYFGDTRSYKLSTTSKEPLDPPPQSLRWFDSARRPRARKSTDGEQQGTSELPPPVPPLRSPSFHAQLTK